MFKHLKPRDIVEFLLFGLGFLALIVIAGFLENAPIGISMWVAVVLALALWIVWAIIVINDRKREAAAPKLYIMKNGVWAEVVNGQQPATRREARIFDQDADVIQHLDYNPKEKKA